ncbi:MAG: hypothetical protein AAF447_20685 [Myxococcota bacterium]
MAGFLVASLLWGGVLFAVSRGPLVLPGHGEDELVEAPPPVAEEAVEAPRPTKRRRRRRRRPPGRRTGEDHQATPTGEATVGDDLGEDEPREIAAGEQGGEEQLPGRAIDSAFDGAMGRIRRCLVLIPGDAEVRGRVTFGLRIAGSGRVTRASLSGPAAVTQTDAGNCLRQVARGLSFPSFDGPEMLVRYPLTLE